jgi:hypothetical protein
MVDLLKARGGEHIQVFGGGGGVIVPAEIRALADKGVRIFSPEDGQRMGLAGMIGEMVMHCDKDLSSFAPADLGEVRGHTESAWRKLAQLITALENHGLPPERVAAIHAGRQGDQDAGHRHHRHRRRGQVVVDRRADPPLPPRPARQAAHRRAPSTRRAARAAARCWATASA